MTVSDTVINHQSHDMSADASQLSDSSNARWLDLFRGRALFRVGQEVFRLGQNKSTLTHELSKTSVKSSLGTRCEPDSFPLPRKLYCFYTWHFRPLYNSFKLYANVAQVSRF